MGNYISCTLAGPVSPSCIRATKVIFPSGETRRLYEPTKAAELMLDAPNSFLVNVRSLQMGRRFSPLNADEDLEIGGVYVFFPMKRLKSTVTAGDMGVLLLAATRRTTRISPASGGDLQIVQKPNLEELVTPEFRHRLSMCKSKKPLLETIVEEPVSLR